jgi:hypothetical protein
VDRHRSDGFMQRTSLPLAFAMFDIDRVVPLNEANFDVFPSTEPSFETKGESDDIPD